MGNEQEYRIGFDPDSIPDKEFRDVPPGRYIMEVTEFELVTAKGGRPMFKMKATIAAGEFEGVPTFENITLPMDNSPEEHQKHAWKLVRFMRAITDNKKWKAASVKPQDVLGGRFVATLGYEEYDGNRYVRIRNANYEPLSAWKGVIPRSPKDVAAKAKSMSKTAPAAVSDDDEVA